MLHHATYNLLECRKLYNATPLYDYSLLHEFNEVDAVAPYERNTRRKQLLSEMDVVIPNCDDFLATEPVVCNFVTLYIFL